MDLRAAVAVCCAGLFSSCFTLPGTPQCPPTDIDKEPTYGAGLRFVNLGREAVQVTLEGEDAGTWVQPLEHKNYVGHVTLIKQRGSVAARNFLPDGGRESVTFPFEFDTTTGEFATLVLVDTTPQRISMNVSVSKQTQGATFGERVRQGLAGVTIEGGVDVEGDCSPDLGATAGTKVSVSLREDTTIACDTTVNGYFTQPAGADERATPYFVHGDDELLVAWVPSAKIGQGLHAPGSVISQGASLLGGALPGGAVVSAAVSSMYVLNGHGSGQPGSVSIGDVVLATDVPGGMMVRVPPNVVAAAARKTTGEAVLEWSLGGTRQTVTLGSALTGPCKPPYLCDFLMGEDTLVVLSENAASSATVLKSMRKGWDGVVKGGGSRFVGATTSTLDSRACVAVLPQDDTCVMGAAAVSSVGALAGGGHGAAAASYASTGRVLQPPVKTIGVEPVRFVVEEQDAVARRFTWLNPPGLTPVQGTPRKSGFAVITAAVGAADQRLLVFVDTSVTPWVASAPVVSR